MSQKMASLPEKYRVRTFFWIKHMLNNGKQLYRLFNKLLSIMSWDFFYLLTPTCDFIKQGIRKAVF